MTHVECIAPIILGIGLNQKLQCCSQVYVIIVMHVYLWVTVTELAAGWGNNGKRITFKNCAPFTDCLSEISNTQVDNAEDIYIVMPMHNLIKYGDNYLNTSGSLWHYCKDKLSLNNANAIVHFNHANCWF